jgi:hypothetical protein
MFILVVSCWPYQLQLSNIQPWGLRSGGPICALFCMFNNFANADYAGMATSFVSYFERLTGGCCHSTNLNLI